MRFSINCVLSIVFHEDGATTITAADESDDKVVVCWRGCPMDQLHAYSMYVELYITNESQY